MYKNPYGLEIHLIKGDITEVEADAIVNAANSYLQHGGGVAYAIVKKGGYVIQKESDEYVEKYGPVPVGEVAVTSAGKLKSKYVIHTVGPRYGIEGKDKLESAIFKSLLKADELSLTSIALPAISTGIYGYPYEICARAMANILKNYKAKSLRKVIVCLYSQDAYDIFKKVFDSILKS
ncbi:ADP-ribose-binding protein [Saccharolobus islandicus]|uniref:Appr-1-p processing domain protein n=4 Tax=Saccharolobus islandicus TaxID=43080 RepID=C4KDU7_SACI6|nr:ADP-ribose-binding protein [Sulfolobus islandicus]ACP37274.1 Appr-1-p processing domain protein [Sulfolobus islandicus M.14.25]ACP54430.1 Appr-1-p processing domain protein [Sulfolobus islandicus M.16.27]ACR41070.1 Appr-1-p processing domain protein [Sulfolobus islandicus M.16.4]